MTMDEQGRGLWRRIPSPQKAAFFSCLVTGYLVHLYAFTNLIPNSDGLSRVFDTQQMTISGRWFLHYASALNNFTQMPAAIGLLSLLFLALAAALTVGLLSIRSRVLAGTAGAVMAAFPCLGYTFLYLFTASAYCLAILLAVLSVWLARRGRLGWLAGAAALALSMGTYQAYASLAVALSLLVVFRACLERESTFASTLGLGLRLVSCLALGAGLYYGILLLFLKVKGLELLSYLGMDQASAGYPLAMLPGLILSAYKQTVAFFFLPGSADGFASLFLVVLDLAALALGVIFLLFRLSALGDKAPWRLAGVLAMIALLPLGVDFAQIISPYSSPTPLMKYAFVCVYLALLLAADLADGLLRTPGRTRLLAGAAGVWAAGLLLFCLNTNNLLYTASAQAHRATQSYVTRLLTRVEDCPGYQRGMGIALIGAVPADQLQSQIESYAQVDHYSVPLDSVVPLNKHLYYYLSDWLNVPVEEPGEETMIALAATQAFQDMPLYPAQGSVQIIDGYVVVKLQETYTPKSDFELAYENRR